MPYTASLDGIRAIAALVIVAYHARIPGLPGGFFGVDVFFVLSGYLVTRLLAEEHAQSGTIRYRAFMQRRIRRLSPALLTMLAAYLLAAPWLFAEVPFARHVRDAWWSALYLLATAWRAASPEHLGDVWAFYIRTDTHCSGLLLGSFIGLLNPPAPARRTAACMATAGIVILAFALTFYSTKWIVTVQYGFTVAEAAAALLVVARPSWLGGAVLAWLGRMSYGLYLWHYPIMRALREQGWENHDWPAILAVGGTLGLMCAVASHHWVEGRFYRRGGGWRPCQRRPGSRYREGAA